MASKAQPTPPGVPFEQALLDPASAFGAPENVVRDPDLTSEQKIEILLRWQYNEAEEDVALEEGMKGEETGMMRRILLALGSLDGAMDARFTAPTKQHGLCRSRSRSKEIPDCSSTASDPCDKQDPIRDQADGRHEPVPRWKVRVTWAGDEAMDTEEVEIYAESSDSAVEKVAARLPLPPHHIEVTRVK